MYNPNDLINARLRQQGMRRRVGAPALPQIVPTQAATSPQERVAPVNPNAPRFSFQPPGVRAREDQYNYERLPDNTWKEYPPGQPAPPTGWQASMAAPASVMDLERMQSERETIEKLLKTRQTTGQPRPTGEPYRDMMR